MFRQWPTLAGMILGLGALYLGLNSSLDPVEGWRLAARWTARVGFPVFLIAYSASALARLWPELFTGVARDRRWWGLGFAASHTVHLLALVMFLRVSGETRPMPVLLFAGGAYAIMFAMALTSTPAAMRALGRNWQRLHAVGIHWLWVVFFASYLGRTMKPESAMAGRMGVTLALTALLLRVAAWMKARVTRKAAA